MLKISNHARERYAERLRDKNDLTDIIAYVRERQQKIDEDLSQMVQYGTTIYRGPSLAASCKSDDVSIYLNHTWVLIVDNKTEKLITIYNIDLGLGREFNDQYISKILEKINSIKNVYEAEREAKQRQIDEFNERITENTNQIQEYKRRIKGLEFENENYNNLIKSNVESITGAGEQIRELVSKLIHKKIY